MTKSVECEPHGVHPKPFEEQTCQSTFFLLRHKSFSSKHLKQTQDALPRKLAENDCQHRNMGRQSSISSSRAAQPWTRRVPQGCIKVGCRRKAHSPAQIPRELGHQGSLQPGKKTSTRSSQMPQRHGWGSSHAPFWTPQFSARVV